MTYLLKLNIGSGDMTIPGFISHDIKDGNDARDLSKYEDGSVDEIYASHVLEHVHHKQTGSVLNEWCRVLKPGGRIRIAVPDFGRVRADFDAGIINDDMYNCMMYGTRPEERDWHQSHFSRDRIEQWLRAMGIEDIHEFESEYEDCTDLVHGCPYSANIEGRKRKFTIAEEPRVTMVLSTPRFGPIDFNHCALVVAQKLGWKFLFHGGTEWGAGLTKAIQATIENGFPDYIMCLDYDSTFTPEDCLELLRLMQENPQISAIYPVQQHRHAEKPLGYIDHYRYSGDLTRVGSGHFGCTMLRTQLFQKLKEPWFMSLPDPDTGKWDGNKCDADIFFWQVLSQNGHSICQANNVIIGHMELCVMWPYGEGTMYQPIQHYREHGKPPQAAFDPAAVKTAVAKGKDKRKLIWRDEHDILGVRGPKPEQANGIAMPASPAKSTTDKCSSRISQQDFDVAKEMAELDSRSKLMEAPDGTRTG